MKFIIFLFIFQYLSFASESKSEVKSACIKGLSANVRSEASLKSSIVVNLQKYTPVQILQENEEWIQIKSKNFKGWVYGDLIVKNLDCVMTLQPEKTLISNNSDDPHSGRSNVEINEGFKIIQTSIGKTKVEDKYGNTFWLENQYLWPKSELEDLNISL